MKIPEWCCGINETCGCHCHDSTREPALKFGEVSYTKFVKAGLATGFTDGQINFLWEFLNHEN